MSDKTAAPEGGAAVLGRVESKRGYDLPYHRMMAAHDPALLDAYDRFYTRLTLAPRVVTMAERELIWTALLVAAREEHGTIHMRRAEAAGLGPDALADAVAVAGAAEAFPALTFASTHWGQWVPEDHTAARYIAVFEAARGGIDPAMAEILAVVCHAARRTHAGMRVHLPRAFAAGADPAAVAEGLSYLLLPCGGPTLIDAVQAWADDAAVQGYQGPY